MSYTCVKCRGKVEGIGESVICTHCGFRILMKNRANGGKTLLAR